MPSKRTLRARGRRPDMPAWARSLIDEGRQPRQRDASEYDEFLGWKFFNETVPGLPAADSEAGRAILKRAREDAKGEHVDEGLGLSAAAGQAERIVSKKGLAPYRRGKTGDWIKVKTTAGQSLIDDRGEWNRR